LLDKGLPGPEWIGVMDVRLVLDEALDKCGTSRPTIDPPAQHGVERDGTIQQQRRCGSVLEMARIHEGFVHHGEIVGICIQTGANAIDIAKRGKELERSGKKAFAVE
jgi:hypothetical protein